MGFGGMPLRGKMKGLAVLAAVAILTVVTAVLYQACVRDLIYRESTTSLSSTYQQVDKSFTQFAQRNWNVLSDWGDWLQSIGDADAVESLWMKARERKSDWGYRDVYLFTADDGFVSQSSRHDSARALGSVFSETLQADRPWISSFISDGGTREIVFAVPWDHPFVYEGITYTGIAVSYDNITVSDLVAGDVYSGQSDCYVLDSSGHIVFALESKTIFKGFISNLFDFLGGKVRFECGGLASLRKGIETKKSGSARIEYEGDSCYLVYRPAGVGDWSLVGIVRGDVVDSDLNEVRYLTMAAIGVVGLLAVVTVALSIRRLQRERFRRKEDERLRLKRQKDAVNQLLGGMGRIVDRFASIDLEIGTYEYHENQSGDLQYPPTGSYEDLIAHISERYVALSEGDDIKLARLLAPDRLRGLIGTSEDVIRIEYCGRNEDVYKVLNIIPLEWGEDGAVRRLMFVSQDIGQRVELQTMANTDGLTGLFNERYFSSLMHARETSGKTFTLFYLDLDHFKPVNDTYGHDAGDRLLRMVSKRLLGCIRQGDFAFRIGGDEFALVVDAELDAAACKSMRERVSAAVRAPYDANGTEVRVGISCGWGVFPREGDAEQVRIISDRRMYERKELHHTER